MPDQQCTYTDQLPGRTLTADGKEFLFFSGTSYLGMSCNQEFRQHLQEGFRLYGTNYSSSRNSNLQLRVYHEAETYLAACTGAEAALTMSSGYLAGQALVQTLQDEGSFLYAPETHPALWRGKSDAPASDISYEEWVQQLLHELPALPDQHIVLVCNSLDPLKAKEHSFSWINALPQNKQITLIIDDSHGFGVTGKDGAGIYSLLGQVKQIDHIRLLVVCSLGKACGIPAGLILGDEKTIEKLKQSPYFGGASPATPAYLYALLHAGKVLSEARQRLFDNIEYFRQYLGKDTLFRSFNRYPVFSTSNEALCPFLMSHQIMISSFRYPTPADDPITRVVLSSLHTSEDIKRLANLINQFKHEYL